MASEQQKITNQKQREITHKINDLLSEVDQCISRMKPGNKIIATEEVKNIKVNISGREYPVNVTPETASAMKKAAEMVNEQASQFQSAYAINDPRDLLAMCALQLAYQNLEYTKHFTQPLMINWTQ